jgi:hypothetical protein
MPCDKECHQGRSCECPRSGDRAAVIVMTLLFIACVAMGVGIYELFNGNSV